MRPLISIGTFLAMLDAGREFVLQNHDPWSHFLIGNHLLDDRIHDVPQRSWIDNQMSLIL